MLKTREGERKPSRDRSSSVNRVCVWVWGVKFYPNQTTTMLMAQKEASWMAAYTGFSTATQAVIESSQHRVRI
jgi:hypothetical protein